MISVAIVGYGYWGKNLARNFFGNQNCELRAIVDTDSMKMASIKKLFPSVRIEKDYTTILSDSTIDAIVLATPVLSHYALAKAGLNSGKHVFVEKPMTSTVREAEELIEIANKKNLILMPDHTFLYTGAVSKMKQLIMAGEIGKLTYYDSTRINLGLFQPDVNVVWDLAPHDISILYHLTNERPFSVTATGVSHLNNGIENIAYVTLNFQSNMIGHFSCSWSSPVKIRKILVGGDRKMILYDDNEVTEKVKIYDTGFSSALDENEKQRILVDYRVGDIYVPKLETKEALAGVAADFINAIQHGTQPVSDWKSGLDVVKVLEAAQISIKQNGREVKI